MRLKFIFPLLVLFLLPACSEVELASHVIKNVPGNGQSQGDFKVGSPYKVGGKWYKPQETYSYTETGIASWYGAEFNGKKTANGEVFDMNELTAAHRTLQLPSLVRVTNLENGRSLIVRVNDRGPFKRGRVIDLSKRAAELLDFKNKGTAKVKIQVLGEESRAIAEAAKRGQDTSGVEVAMNQNRSDPRLTLNPPAQQRSQPVALVQPEESYRVASVDAFDSAPLPPPSNSALNDVVPGHMGRSGNFYPDPVVEQMSVSPSSIYVQAAAFTDRTNAQKLALSLKSFGEAKVYPALVNGRQFYRVRFGPLPDVERADGLLERLASNGHRDPIIVVD